MIYSSLFKYLYNFKVLIQNIFSSVINIKLNSKINSIIKIRFILYFYHAQSKKIFA